MGKGVLQFGEGGRGGEGQCETMEIIVVEVAW